MKWPLVTDAGLAYVNCSPFMECRNRKCEVFRDLPRKGKNLLLHSSVGSSNRFMGFRLLSRNQMFLLLSQTRFQPLITNLVPSIKGIHLYSYNQGRNADGFGFTSKALERVLKSSLGRGSSRNLCERTRDGNRLIVRRRPIFEMSLLKRCERNHCHPRPYLAG